MAELFAEGLASLLGGLPTCAAAGQANVTKAKAVNEMELVFMVPLIRLLRIVGP